MKFLYSWFPLLSDKYNFISNRGENFGFNFYSVEDKLNKNKYIIGFMDTEDRMNSDYIVLNEKKIKSLKILSKIKSPYILRYITDGEGKLSFRESPYKVGSYIIYEYASEFVLFDYIEIKQFPEIQLKLLFYKILQGIKTIHEANICHRNINEEHILFDEDYNPKIFGFELLCENKENLTDFFGNPHYCAP